MEEEKDITLGELIESEKFQSLLAEHVRMAFLHYDNAVTRLYSDPVARVTGKVKRNPMMRLREMGAEDPKKMTELYVSIIDHKSDLPTILRNYVRSICNPVLNKCLADYAKKIEVQET